MASKASKGDEMSSVLRDVLHKLSDIIAKKCDRRLLQTLESKSELVRQSTRAQYGDICIPRGVVTMAFKTGQQVEGVTKAILSESESLPLPILSCSPCDNGFISIRLHRPPAFRRIIHDIIQQGGAYGHGAPDRGVVLVNAPNTQKAGADGVTALRQSLVAQHASALMEANGYKTYEVHQHDHRVPSPLGNILGADKSQSPSSTEVDSSAVHPQIHGQLSRSKYVSSVACQTEEKPDPDRPPPPAPWGHAPDGDGLESARSEGLRLPSQCLLELGAVLEDQSLRIGKGGYSQNLSQVQLTTKTGEVTSVLRQCSDLQHAVDQVKSKGCTDQLSVLHIVLSNCEFTQQQADLTLRALSPDCHSCHHVHLSCAPVDVTGYSAPDQTREGDSSKAAKQSITVEELYAVRESQMREASVMKYGAQVKGERWDDMIRTLTAAGIKFDILGTHFRHPVKLELGESRDNSPWPDNRNGVFVVYNYARLSTLFSRFQEEVRKGTYPPLPPLESIDFSTLKEEAEWKLLFSHLLNFPDVVGATIGDGFTTQDLYCKFEIQKICRYLISLSQDLSAYYSRFRILTEPRPHLLPTLYARLYLLKAVHQVLSNGLALLRIRPLTQM